MSLSWLKMEFVISNNNCQLSIERVEKYMETREEVINVCAYFFEVLACKFLEMEKLIHKTVWVIIHI